MMMMMMAMRAHGALHVLDERLERVLRPGSIIGLKRGLQGLKVLAERAVLAEQPAQWILPRVVLQILRERRQGALRR